ncbi:MAG: hypothetical protein N3E45_11810 [Oscillatoriaceae bacterium SKW80]|nr:hypothetical protein [Oscillatoriaceae bacterium SKYG93]MCX8121488.1 hypothetical protein [Oscillatoriaceae bacterium SKW80]MDW8452926.1 hypothetical protein [Oscillatoriaceae cyanobacterium SKYGB_i_bin93]HIK27833.1 hypothetical protein [Oscillatoriaceae cyanobacterium M7585_C2015_266]
MGRNAKLRQQRKEGNISSGIAAQKFKDQFFIGKEISLIKRAPSVKPKEVEIKALEFAKKNNIAMGAMAREGFEKLGKGLIFVEEGEVSKMEYVAQKLIKKKLNTRGLHPEDVKAIANMVEEYNPEKNLVMVYISPTGEITATSNLKLQPISQSGYIQ